MQVFCCSLGWRVCFDTAEHGLATGILPGRSQGWHHTCGTRWLHLLLWLLSHLPPPRKIWVLLNDGSRASASSWGCVTHPAVPQGALRGVAVTGGAFPALDRMKQPLRFSVFATNEPNPEESAVMELQGWGWLSALGGFRRTETLPWVLHPPSVGAAAALSLPTVLVPHPAATPEVTPVTSATGAAPQPKKKPKKTCKMQPEVQPWSCVSPWRIAEFGRRRSLLCYLFSDPCAAPSSFCPHSHWGQVELGDAPGVCGTLGVGMGGLGRAE